LLKPRVVSLVALSGLVGLVLAPGTLHPVLAMTAILCIAVGAGAAGAINMWYERDLDALMQRTRNRPLPAGRMAPDTALAFGATMAVASVTVMGLAVNHMAALLLAVSILFYVFVYTVWLKRRTPQNIVIGGAAGAFPPLIGWAAVTGGVDLMPLALFALIFLWTPPHFWALALVRSDDYARAGVPMLPVVAGERTTRRQIMAYTLAVALVSLVPVALGAGWIYGAGAAVLGCLFVAGAFRLLIAPSPALARGLFGFSILYLALIFALLMLDAGALGRLAA
jgi:protoheme IX farnesyltransferase